MSEAAGNAILEYTSVHYYCPKCDKEITKILKEYEIVATADSCDTCGSHGSVEVDTFCRCGKSITLEIISW